VADLNFLKKAGDISTLRAPGVSVTSLSSLISGGAIIFTIGTFIAMGGLFLWYRYQTGYLGDLHNQKRAIEDDLRPELVNRLISVDVLLGQARQLLQSHVWPSNVFAFLESAIHAKAFVHNLQLSPDARHVDVDLVVPSYLVFSEQIKIFESSPLVERISFASPVVAEKGTSFKVSITFKPAVFERSK
jgi:hypothetical protein